MTRAWKTLIAMQLAVLLVAISALGRPTPRLLWNASASVPIGLYRVQSIYRLSVMALVVVRPPEPLASFLSERGYLPRGVPLVKRIAAVPGQIVCRAGLGVTIDGVPWGVALERDHAGRPLPVWRGCRAIAPGQVFLMNPGVPASLDGRYFGPIPSSGIVGRAFPLWAGER